MSVIIKYRAVEKKMKGRFNARTTTTKWIYTILEIALEFVLN